jgi:hypothetical protein
MSQSAPDRRQPDFALCLAKPHVVLSASNRLWQVPASGVVSLAARSGVLLRAHRRSDLRTGRACVWQRR